MYTSEALLDVVERTHRSLNMLMDHCQELEVEGFSRNLDGFGYPSIRLQLHHVVGAQKYWIGVLDGRMDVDEDEDEYPTVDSLKAYQRTVFDLTRDYLRSASQQELNESRAMVTWGNQTKELTPAHVVLRTLMHVYQHQGQIAAMCRLLGKPIPPGLDFPLS